VNNAMKVPPAAEQPEIVEAWRDVKEYWYETFRRVLLIRDANGCIVLSFDVYSKLDRVPQEYKIVSRLGTGAPVEIIYADASNLVDGIDYLKPDKVEIVIIHSHGEVGERYEISDVRIVCCSCRDLSYEEVYNIYRVIVERIEQRSLESSVLEPPKPVERVYSTRLNGRRRGYS